MRSIQRTLERVMNIGLAAPNSFHSGTRGDMDWENM